MSFIVYKEYLTFKCNVKGKHPKIQYDTTVNMLIDFMVESLKTSFVSDVTFVTVLWHT